MAWDLFERLANFYWRTDEKEYLLGYVIQTDFAVLLFGQLQNLMCQRFSADLNVFLSYFFHFESHQQKSMKLIDIMMLS